MNRKQSKLNISKEFYEKGLRKLEEIPEISKENFHLPSLKER